MSFDIYSAALDVVELYKNTAEESKTQIIIVNKLSENIVFNDEKRIS
jgi:hypothetical protein